MKLVNGIINVLTTLIIGLGLVFLVLCAIGITPYVVLSGSMEPKIPTGSLCFINENVKYRNVGVGDVIAFRTYDGTLVTHRIVNKTSEGVTTKGDANVDNDAIITNASNFVGKNIFRIPKVGYLVKTVQTPKGKIILGTAVLMLFAAGLLLGDSNKKEEYGLVITDWDLLKTKHSKDNKKDR